MERTCLVARARHGRSSTSTLTLTIATESSLTRSFLASPTRRQPSSRPPNVTDARQLASGRICCARYSAAWWDQDINPVYVSLGQPLPSPPPPPPPQLRPLKCEQLPTSILNPNTELISLAFSKYFYVDEVVARVLSGEHLQGEMSASRRGVAVETRRCSDVMHASLLCY